MRTVTQETQWGMDHYVFMEASEIPAVLKKYEGVPALSNRFDDKWCGGTFEELKRYVALGDESRVRRTDNLLTQIEDQLPATRAWRNVDDVVGAVPNVPAFLAGHPQHMRRRERASKENAPITIFLDLTSSAVISADMVERRAVVLLALVRLLVEHRPVELWAGIAQDVGKGSGTVAWRIDTAPMDLARAAYHIASTNMARRFGYGLNTHLNRAGGHWPFRDPHLGARTAAERLQRIFGGEIFHIAPLLNTDKMVSQPVAWLKETMAKYVTTED